VIWNGGKSAVVYCPMRRTYMRYQAIDMVDVGAREISTKTRSNGSCDIGRAEGSTILRTPDVSHQINFVYSASI